MKKTFRELLDFSSAFQILSAKNPGLPETKFGYAVKRFVEKNITHVFKEYNEQLADIRTEHALTDEKTKAIIFDNSSPRGFQYSKEGFKEVVKAERQHDLEWETKEFDVTPFISKEYPELTEEQKEIFTGLVI